MPTMKKKSLQFITLVALTIFIGGCGKVQSSYWIAFADSLGTGSKVEPKEVLFTWKNDIEVSITKAADPEWRPNVQLDYPYAGVLMRFQRSGKSVDLSAATAIHLEYQLEGEISMRLVQDNIEAGKEYRIELSAQKEFAIVVVDWEEFAQPDWVADKQELDLTRLSSIMFTNSSKEHSTANLKIRTMDFPNWNDPGSFKTQIKKIGL